MSEQRVLILGEHSRSDRLHSSYDTHGVFSSPRALFMFRSFGHANSSILNGGMPLWEESGLSLEDGTPAEYERADYPLPELNTAAIRG